MVIEELGIFGAIVMIISIVIISCIFLDLLIFRPFFFIINHLIYYPIMRKRGYICDGEHYPYKPNDYVCYTLQKTSPLDPFGFYDKMPKMEYTPKGIASILLKMKEAGEIIEKSNITLTDEEIKEHKKREKRIDDLIKILKS